MSEQTPNAAPNERAVVIFLTAETPVHAGAGGVLAALDLPIQRSVQTEWPILNDSSLRGALRAWADELARQPGSGVTPEMVADWFGSEPPGQLRAGALATPDAEILLFPVTAVRGMTAWVTCREAIQYFARKVKLFEHQLSEGARNKLGQLESALQSMPEPGPQEALVTTGSAVAWEQAGKVVLETDTYRLRELRVDDLAKWFADNACPHSQYWQDRIRRRFVVLPEHAFRHYTKRKTDIRTRVKLEASTVQTGPWTEENLPVDTLLYTVLAQPDGDGNHLKGFLKAIQIEQKPALQLGGDQNLGRGFLRLRRLGG